MKAETVASTRAGDWLAAFVTNDAADLFRWFELHRILGRNGGRSQPTWYVTGGGDNDVETVRRLAGRDNRIVPLAVGRSLPGVNLAARGSHPDSCARQSGLVRLANDREHQGPAGKRSVGLDGSSRREALPGAPSGLHLPPRWRRSKPKERQMPLRLAWQSPSESSSRFSDWNDGSPVCRSYGPAASRAMPRPQRSVPRSGNANKSCVGEPSARIVEMALSDSWRARLARLPEMRLARSLALARCKVEVDWVEKPTAKGAILLRT